MMNNLVDSEIQDEFLRKVEAEYISSMAAPVMNQTQPEPVVEASTTLDIAVESEGEEEQAYLLLNQSQREHIVDVERGAKAHWKHDAANYLNT